MKTVTLILPLETTTVSDSRSDSSSDSVATVGAAAAAMERQKHIKATAERQMSNSGATEVRQRRDNGETTESIAGVTA